VTFDPSVLALAGVVVAGLAAIASPFASLMVARARNEHESRQAATERRQRRRETAYREVVPYLLRTRDAVARTEPMWRRDGDPGPPDALPEDELRRLEAEATLYGSPAVLDLLLSLAALGRSFSANVEVYRAMKSGPAAYQPVEGESPGGAMEESRRQLFEAVQATLKLMNEELQE
jgi:hypothetical protein